MDIRNFFAGNKAPPVVGVKRKATEPSAIKSIFSSASVNGIETDSSKSREMKVEEKENRVPSQESVKKIEKSSNTKDDGSKDDLKMNLDETKVTLTPYANLVDCFEKIEATKKRLEIQSILTELFGQAITENSTKKTMVNSLESFVYLCINKVAPDFEGIELGIGEGLIVKALVKATGREKKAISNKYKEVGDLGLVAQQFKSSQSSLFGHKPKPLTIERVRKDLRKIASLSSQDLKLKIIDSLLVAASGKEAKYIVRSLQGKLRIGLAEQTVLISLAKLFSEESEISCSEDLSNREALTDAVNNVKHVFCQLPVYERLIEALVETNGTKTLEETCHVTAGIPLKPMLAKPTNGISVIFERFAELDFTCEYKYDGERAQIHLLENGKVEIYSRNSENNTGKFPDLVPVIAEAGNNVKSFILDSEVVAYDDKEGKLLPFQKLTTRKRKDVSAESITVKVIVCAFDLLFLNGESLLEKSLKERRDLLKTHFKEVEHKFTFAKSLDSSMAKHNEDEEELTNFLTSAVDDNCEGLMVKTLKDTYQPSKRSLNWLKLKKDYMNGLGDSLDLVPIGVFYGKGKRTGKFGSFLLASYNESEGQFESVTKIGTGFSDEFLQEITETFKAHVAETKPGNYDSIMQPDVWLVPKHVWEVKAADLSISPIHRSAIGLVSDSKGVALRFPRFLRIREDKTPEEATTNEQVADMYRSQNLHTTESDRESLY